MGVREAFDNVAEEYDLNRKVLIPCFDDFYGSAVRLVKIIDKTAPKILDLGIGTGLLSALVLDEIPDAQITGIDISENMLVQAKNRFKGRVELVAANYLTGDIGSGYDAVISSLSIHHLDCKDKAKLFYNVYDSLNVGGVFVNADQVKGDSNKIECMYRDVWYEQMRMRGITEELLAASEERMKEDQMSTLTEQLQWLKDAGFVDVNCWYKNFIFTVYAGMKD